MKIQDKINSKQILSSFYTIEKGVYVDNAKNKKLGRVGQQYGGGNGNSNDKKDTNEKSNYDESRSSVHNVRNALNNLMNPKYAKAFENVDLKKIKDINLGSISEDGSRAIILDLPNKNLLKILTDQSTGKISIKKYKKNSRESSFYQSLNGINELSGTLEKVLGSNSNNDKESNKSEVKYNSPSNSKSLSKFKESNPQILSNSDKIIEDIRNSGEDKDFMQDASDKEKLGLYFANLRESGGGDNDEEKNDYNKLKDLFENNLKINPDFDDKKGVVFYKVDKKEDKSIPSKETTRKSPKELPEFNSKESELKHLDSLSEKDTQELYNVDSKDEAKEGINEFWDEKAPDEEEDKDSREANDADYKNKIKKEMND